MGGTFQLPTGPRWQDSCIGEVGTLVTRKLVVGEASRHAVRNLLPLKRKETPPQALPSIYTRGIYLYIYISITWSSFTFVGACVVLDVYLSI